MKNAVKTQSPPTHTCPMTGYEIPDLAEQAREEHARVKSEVAGVEEKIDLANALLKLNGSINIETQITHGNGAPETRCHIDDLARANPEVVDAGALIQSWLMTHTEREAEARRIVDSALVDAHFYSTAANRTPKEQRYVDVAVHAVEIAIARAEQAEARIERLVNLRDIQSSQGNFDCDEYMRGMANGLILAVCTMRDDEPKFHEATPSPQAEPVGLEPHVFLDCDGVLADFDTYAEAYFGMNPRAYEAKVGSAQFWAELEAKGDFYRNLPLMPDAMTLYEGVKHLNPTILTGCPRGDWAQGQKVAWAAEHFPGVAIITCKSANKRDYAKAGDVLIDDWAQHRHRWIEMGGIFITHHDADTSLAALRAHYPALSPIGGKL